MLLTYTTYINMMIIQLHRKNPIHGRINNAGDNEKTGSKGIRPTSRRKDSVHTSGTFVSDQVKIGFEFPNEYVIERDDMSRPTRLEHPIRKPDTQRI